MAKAYSNDLRQRFLSAYERGEGTLSKLAARFIVSLDYGKKLRRHLKRTGRMDRVEQVRGTPRSLLAEHRRQLPVWIRETPDLTLLQLQDKLRIECRVSISTAQIGRVLKQMGLRLKKSHSTPKSATRKRTTAGVKRSSSGSARSRRRG
jgi:transposase